MSSSRSQRPNLPEVYKNRNIRRAKETNASEFAEFMKENFGEDTFSNLIFRLSTHVTVRGHVLTKYPSWLTDIMQEFIKLLQATPKFPDIFIPLQEILNIYVPKGGLHARPINKEDFIKTCNEIVDKFITDNRLGPPNSEIATNIKIFFTRIVFILFDFIDKNYQSHDVETRVYVASNINNLIPILKRLIQLIQLNHQNKKIIVGLNMEDVVRYGKSERESDIENLKQQDPQRYIDEWSIAQGLSELIEERQEERRRQRAYAGQGGRKKNIRSLCKKRKRTYKKRSYKKM